MEWLEQLPCPPVEVDEGVEGPGLGDPVDQAEIDPSIVGPDITFGVVVGELGDSESEKAIIFIVNIKPNSNKFVYTVQRK